MKNKPETQIKTNTDTQSIPEVYTNAVLTNMTPYEFEITLGLGSSNYEGVRPGAALSLSKS